MNGPNDNRCTPWDVALERELSESGMAPADVDTARKLADAIMALQHPETGTFLSDSVVRELEKWHRAWLRDQLVRPEYIAATVRDLENPEKSGLPRSRQSSRTRKQGETSLSVAARLYGISESTALKHSRPVTSGKARK